MKSSMLIALLGAFFSCSITSCDLAEKIDTDVPDTRPICNVLGGEAFLSPDRAFEFGSGTGTSCIKRIRIGNIFQNEYCIIADTIAEAQLFLRLERERYDVIIDDQTPYSVSLNTDADGMLTDQEILLEDFERGKSISLQKMTADARTKIPFVGTRTLGVIINHEENFTAEITIAFTSNTARPDFPPETTWSFSLKLTDPNNRDHYEVFGTIVQTVPFHSPVLSIDSSNFTFFPIGNYAIARHKSKNAFSVQKIGYRETYTVLEGQLE